ncbi:hypothetical protein EBZ39_00795 [bacterium]|nr:hypothetical protein [bacterium]
MGFYNTGMNFDFSLNKLNPFLCISLFCIAYTIFDVAGSAAALLNKSGSGIISENSSSVISTSTKKNTNAVVITIDLPTK